MSLNPVSSVSDVSSPCAKLSFNINAFNGNKTNFNRACPSPKTMVPASIQPRQPQQEVPSLPSFSRKPSPGVMMPM